MRFLILEKGKSQAKRDFVNTGKISQEDFNKIFSLLPSNLSSKYGYWVVKQIVKNDIDDIDNFIDMVIPLLERFDELKNNHVLQGKEADIEQYTKETLEEKLETADWESKEKILEEGTKILKETDDYIVYRIYTFKASQILGRGTKWCISGTKEGEWNYHNDHFYIYFVIRKKNKRKNNEWDKVAVLVYKTNPRYWAITTAIDWEYFDFKYLKQHYPDLNPNLFGISNPSGEDIAMHYFKMWVNGNVKKCHGDYWCIDGNFYVDVPQFVEDYVNSYVGVETMLRRYGINIHEVQGVQRTLAFPIYEVSGDFVYKNGNLEAARNFPKYVGGNFDISGNRISNVNDLLSNFPKHVGGNVALTGNPVVNKITEDDLRKISDIKGNIIF